jgi:hypothetical protein
MTKINSILSERLKSQEGQPKMASLAKKSSTGALTSFSGMFGVTELSEGEKLELSDLLERFSLDACNIEQDLKALSSITLEVKAINNQAALLHGERIKKAQALLKSYQEGAFTAWLMRVYGNRQTPYNFLQYYEFYLAISKDLHPIVETLPRQVVYTLASRDGEIEKKETVVKEAPGKSKQELLTHIRNTFPLSRHDKRAYNSFFTLLNILQKALPIASSIDLDKQQKEAILSLLTNIKSRIQ